ncbi:hypothetical protein, partial [Pseudomonas aeruginosa]|uniref:hypothetical protein n=1 Tax=Pseudomonas aeruginosa TaxID=287 RepID=UPI001CDA0E10
ELGAAGGKALFGSGGLFGGSAPAEPAKPAVPPVTAVVAEPAKLWHDRLEQRLGIFRIPLDSETDVRRETELLFHRHRRRFR